MDYGIFSCIPIAILIIGVLVTKRIIEMMLVSVTVAMIMYYKAGFLSGFVGALYQTVSTEGYQFLLFLVLGFGALIRLFEKSGALIGFSNAVQKIAKTKKRALFLTWLLGILVFVDDYLNILMVSAAMKGTTDKLEIPREHLAYAINSMGACVCVLIPFSSWSAFMVGCIGQYDLEWADYVKSLPYMFFPIIAILVCLLVALGIIPKVGSMKKAYKRVEEGGPLLPEENTGATVVNLEVEDKGEPSSPWNFIVPIVVLIGGMIAFDNDIIHGIIIAIFVQGIMYIAQRIMTVEAFLNNMLEGIASMASLGVCIALGSIMASTSDAMGFTGFVVTFLGRAIPPTLIPVVTFVAVAAIAWAACNFWVLIMLITPVFLPLAISLGMNPSIIIAAIMSGVAVGAKLCFYSDAIFMTAAGTGVQNMTQIRTVAPYVLSAAVLSAVGFLVIGLIAV